MITRHAPLTRVITDDHIRCTVCQKLLAERATRPWRISCSRCGHTNLALPRQPPTGQLDIELSVPAKPKLPRNTTRNASDAPPRRRRRATRKKT